MTDRSEARLLSEAWDRLLAGDPDPADPALAPGLVETLRLLHALHDPAVPNPAFRARLRREMTDPAAGPARLAAPPDGGRDGGRGLRPAEPGSGRIGWGRSAGPALAAAALVLALLGGLVVLLQRGVGPQPQPDDRHLIALAPTDVPGTPRALVPTAAAASPIPVPSSAGVDQRTLFAGRLDVPANAGWLGYEEWAVPADFAWERGTEQSDGIGPVLVRVDIGTVTVLGDHSFTLTRPGQAPLAVSPGTTVALGPGDELAIPGGVDTHWRNVGAAEATLSGFAATTLGSGVNDHLTTFSIFDLLSVHGLNGQATDLALRQVTLAPGAALAPAPGSGVAKMAVQFGTVTVDWAKRSAPDVVTGSIHPTAESGMVDIEATNFFAKQLRNEGTEPVTLVLFTARPVPSSTPATPAPSLAGVDQQTLFAGRLDVPTNASWLGYEEWVVPAGRDWELGAPWPGGIGPLLARVDTGSLTVQGDHPFTLTRAGQAPVTVAPGTPVPLGPGDTVLLPAGVDSHWQNAGPAEATFRDFGAGPIGDESGEPMNPFSINVVGTAGALYGRTADFALRQVTLAPGAAFAPESGAGVAKFVVRSGSVTVDWTQQPAPQVVAADTDPAATPEAIDLVSSTDVVKQFRNNGTAPVTLLLFTARPAAAAAPATPAPAVAIGPGIDRETLFQQRVEAIPETANCLSVEREILQQGGRLTMGTLTSAYHGPMAFKIEAGTFEVAADGPATLTRAGGDPVPVVAYQTITLGVDDLLSAPTDTVTHWANSSATESRLVDVGVVDTGLNYSPVAVGETNVGLLVDCGGPVVAALGSRAAELIVERLTLAPGARLPWTPGPGLAPLEVEAGTLSLVWADRSAPGTPVLAVGPHQLTADGASADLNGGRYVATELRNDTTVPISVLLMTVRPVPASTPGAAMPQSAAATPDAATPGPVADAAPVDLFRQRIDDVPARASWLGYDERGVPPGAALEQGTSATSGVGPMVYRVDAGELVVRADGAFTVTRADGSTEPVAAGAEARVGLGDRAALPGVASHWRNDGTAPARLADTGATTTGAGDFGSLLAFSVYESTPEFSGAPAELLTREIRLGPGQEIPSDLGGRPAVLGIRSGALTVVWADRAAPDVPTGDFTFGPSSGSFPVNHGNVVAHAFRNTGDEPLVFVLFTATALTGDAATPASSPAP